jgi:hypothetical protein
VTSNRVFAYDQSDASWTSTNQLTNIGDVEASSFPLCEPGDCADGNPCTDDLCNPDLGCQNPDNADSCEDGDPCTDSDQCSGGACQPGPPPDCDPGDACLIGFCDAELGCVSEPNPACVTSVPALSPAGRGVLALTLVLAAALLTGRRRPRAG